LRIENTLNYKQHKNKKNFTQKTLSVLPLINTSFPPYAIRGSIAISWHGIKRFVQTGVQSNSRASQSIKTRNEQIEGELNANRLQERSTQTRRKFNAS